jgi:hypothetical protein
MLNETLPGRSHTHSNIVKREKEKLGKLLLSAAASLPARIYDMPVNPVYTHATLTTKQPGVSFLITAKDYVYKETYRGDFTCLGATATQQAGDRHVHHGLVSHAPRLS